MLNDQEQINALLQRLELLLKKQQDFNLEVNEIRRDIQILRNTQAIKFNQASQVQTIKPKETSEDKRAELKEPKVAAFNLEPTPGQIQRSKEISNAPLQKMTQPKSQSNLEKFIGENLINKVGILITIIGVVIGAKYSIENNLISPLTRIILGYLIGIGLVSIGFKLKASFKNYSAVLVSGALAILYFITFAAYDFYGLFPQLVAFGIMLFCTIFGVVAALNYNKQVIAHIGLVGAYGVPFLLSNNSGSATILFSYIVLINMGILVISFKKYWKALYYLSFAFSWLIFGVWYAFSGQESDFTMAFTFLTIFYLLFYTLFLAFKLLKYEQFKVSDVVLILLNSFIFYGLGISLLNGIEEGQSYVGLFTLANALVHFAITVFIYQRKLADRKLFFLTSGFVLTFVTIAIPVQLDGNWVTLIWTFEALLLFWIGRTKKVSFYEHLSYILTALSIISLSMDWSNTYSWLNTSGTDIKPIVNTTFLSSILCTLAFGTMNRIQMKFSIERKTVANKFMNFGIPALFVLTLFLSIYYEIGLYWNSAFEASKVNTTCTTGYYPEYNYNLIEFESIWKLLYSMLFVSILSLLNVRKIKNKVVGIISLCLGLLLTFIFLSNGLYIISELRENFLEQELAEYYQIGLYNIYIRYIALVFFAILLSAIHKLVRQDYLKINYKIPFEILVHIAIIWVTSSELLNWLDLIGSEQSYKLGLSILWGLYALLLIALGIWKNKKHMRIGAIILFSLTLVKLFLYDISSLDTIAKTIVFVSLGILLLIISFLYNKYKHIISDETK